MAGLAPRGRPRLLPVAAIAIALAVCPPAAAQKMPRLGPFPGNRVGDLAYDFTLHDLNDRKVSLKDMRGQRVVHLVFWATWCVPCLQEIPELRVMHDRYGDRGLQILGIVVHMNQTPDKVRTVARDMRIGYPILYDKNGDVQARYKVDAIPQNFLIGRDGIIRYAGTSLPQNYGSIVEELLRDGGRGTPAGR